MHRVVAELEERDAGGSDDDEVGKTPVEKLGKLGEKEININRCRTQRNSIQPSTFVLCTFVCVCDEGRVCIWNVQHNPQTKSLEKQNKKKRRKKRNTQKKKRGKGETTSTETMLKRKGKRKSEGAGEWHLAHHFTAQPTAVKNKRKVERGRKEKEKEWNGRVRKAEKDRKERTKKKTENSVSLEGEGKIKQREQQKWERGQRKRRGCLTIQINVTASDRGTKSA